MSGSSLRGKILCSILIALLPLTSTPELNSTNPTDNSLNITASPSARSVNPGDTTTFAIFVSGAVSGNPNIQIFPEPPIPFTNSISFSFTQNNMPSPFNSTMLVTADGSTQPGTYQIWVCAHPRGTPFPSNETQYTSVTLYVLPSSVTPFDFAIAVTPESTSVMAGQSATFIVDVSLVAGPAALVTLNLTGLPNDSSFYFSTISERPPYTSTLTIDTRESALPGTFVLTIIGVGGGLDHSTSIQLTVTHAKSQSSISLSVNPTKLFLGEKVTLVGTISPAVAVAIDVVLRRPDGLETVKNVTTHSDGTFAYSFEPDMVGDWSATASWRGNENLKGCESSPVGYRIETRPPSSVTATTTQGALPAFGWILEALDKNSLFVIAVLSILAIFFAALAMRTRSRRAVAPQVRKCWPQEAGAR